MAERAHPGDLSFRGTIYEERLRERYAFCLPYVQDRDVLDVPCGTGWGSAMLSGVNTLTALDIDAGAIRYAKEHYPGIRFVEGPMQALPFDDGSFDTLLCLEGIEHVYLSDARSFLREAHRVLRAGGVLVLTAPLLNGGKHSTNPYHAYEFTADELRQLLDRYFTVEVFEVFQGGDGPEARFVGRRAERICDERRPTMTADTFDRAYRWALSLAGERGFSFTAGGPESVIATSCAVLILGGLGRLDDVEGGARARWAGYLSACQRPHDGRFVDPLLETNPVESREHDLEYLLDQTTYFALQALDTLGRRPQHAIAVLERWPTPEAITTWLEELDWSNAWLQSNRVMFVLSFLVDQVERLDNPAAAALYHAVLDWLDTAQDHATGLWGTQQRASLLNAMAAAYHFLPFYEYVHRPINGLRAMIDATLSLQQPDGLFAAGLGGGACEDLDAIGVLAVASRHSAHRWEEVKRAAVRAFWALWNTQNEDGGFGYAAREDEQIYRFSSWAPLESRLRVSDVWATWSRLIAIGTLRHWFAEDLPALPPWRFQRWPGLGYHRDGPGLTEQERVVLPRWLRPLPVRDAPPITAPVISVVMTCYNLGAYLSESATSVLQQSLQDVELVIVDDGSTDDYTQLVLASIDHPQISVLRQENRGLPAARNAGIRAARGAYICCLDADDRLRPRFLELALAKLEADPELGFVSSYYQEFDGRHGIVRHTSCSLPDMLVTNRAMVASLFRRAAWEQVGGYCEELSGLHDWDLWIGILERGYRAAVIPEVLFDYRVRDGSMYTGTRRPDNYARLVGMIFDRHRELYGRWQREVVAGYAHELTELVHYAEGQASLARQLATPRAGQSAEIEALRTMAEARASWIEQLEHARDFHIQQATNWQRVAEEQATRIAELESSLAIVAAASSRPSVQRVMRGLRRRLRGRDGRIAG